jgi:hypothetical protein
MPSGSSKDSLLLELPAAGPVGGGIHYIFFVEMAINARYDSSSSF